MMTKLSHTITGGRGLQLLRYVRSTTYSSTRLLLLEQTMQPIPDYLPVLI